MSSVHRAVIVLLLAACASSERTPRPPRTLDAFELLTRADAQYDRGDVAGARASYLAVTMPADNAVRWYVRYRIAWCDFTLGNLSLARDEMTEVSHAPATPKTARLISAAADDLARWSDRDNRAYLDGERAYAEQRFCDAAPLYARAVDDMPPGAARDEAAYAHVLATRACEHLVDTVPDPDRHEPMSPAYQRLLAALDLYVAHVASSSELATIRFLRARIHYGFEDLAAAAPDFRAIMTASPDDETAGPAALLLLDCDNRLHLPELWSDLRAACALPAARADTLAAVCAATPPPSPDR